MNEHVGEWITLYLESLLIKQWCDKLRTWMWCLSSSTDLQVHMIQLTGRQILVLLSGITMPLSLLASEVLLFKHFVNCWNM